MTYAPASYRTDYYSAAADPVDWAAEARTAGLVITYVSLLGAVVGLLWHALGPHIDIVNATEGSVSAMKALIGDDVWLGSLGAIAGVVCVAVLILVAPEESQGPGAMVGLAVGGFLAMLVAARVGHQVGHRQLASNLKAGFPGITPKGVKLVLGYFDFSVRAKSVLLAWPLASILVNGVIMVFRPPNQARPYRASAYPGSS